MATFFVLLLLIVLVFSLLGVELFSNYVKFDSEGNVSDEGTSPRLNFDDPLNGVISVFTCLIGDDWQYIMHDLIRVKRDRVMPCLYFLLVMIIGNLFLMNLFLAILLKNFEEKIHGSEDERQAILLAKIQHLRNEEKEKQRQAEKSDFVGSLLRAVTQSPKEFGEEDLQEKH